MKIPLDLKCLLHRLRGELDARGRGARADLARHCGVNDDAVSAWLAEPPRRQPDGERVLAILRWLEP